MRQLTNNHSGHEVPAISLIAPMYNESDNISTFYKKLSTALNILEYSWELICINDGSKDDTLDRLLELRQQDTRIKVLNFSRNFGKEMALTAGLEYAAGKIVVPIDSDLQHPPEMIVKMIEEWEKGADIVFGVRRSRDKESTVKRISTKIFYKLFGHISGIRNHNKIGDFCLLDRKVVDVIKQLPEKNRFMKGLFAWVGYETAYVKYDLQDRHAGKTKWNYWRLWNFALEGITSFSTIPLRIWTYLGFTIAAIAILYAGWITYEALVNNIVVPGYASLMVALLLLGGIQLISLGIIGEYLGRIYVEVKGRPPFIIRDTYGLNEKDKAMFESDFKLSQDSRVNQIID